jgi:hypothetical protein
MNFCEQLIAYFHFIRHGPHTKRKNREGAQTARRSLEPPKKIRVNTQTVRWFHKLQKLGGVECTERWTDAEKYIKGNKPPFDFFKIRNVNWEQIFYMKCTRVHQRYIIWVTGWVVRQTTNKKYTHFERNSINIYLVKNVSKRGSWEKWSTHILHPMHLLFSCCFRDNCTDGNFLLYHLKITEPCDWFCKPLDLWTCFNRAPLLFSPLKHWSLKLI